MSSSSSWMFGGTGDAAPHDLMQAKKTFFNRDWKGDEASGLQIGGESMSTDKDSVFTQKRKNQAAVKAALDADKVAKEMTRRLEKEKENGGLGEGVVELDLDWKGGPAQQHPVAPVIPSIPAKYSVASMIRHESSPENSPRYRNRQELQGEDEEVEKLEAFGIGESADAIKRRKKAQREQYLQALDRDTGFTRETVARAPRAPREYEETSTGVTGFQIGLSAPTLDMSPSMKNLTLESKRRSQESYRSQLAQQSTARRSKKEMLSERVSAAKTEPTTALPFMR